MLTPKKLFVLAKRAFGSFLKDDAFAKAAAVSYYAIFSLPGLFGIVIFISSALFFEEEIFDEINEDLTMFLGEHTADQLTKIFNRIKVSSHFTSATLLASLSLVFGVTTLFVQLQNSLNAIWGVHKKHGVSFVRLLFDRLVSLALVLLLNVLFLSSLILNTLIHTINTWITRHMVQGFYHISYGLKFAIILAIFTFAFAAIYKFLPDVIIKWKLVWRGALITAILFSIGEEAISFYLSHSNLQSSYGTASSIVLLLLWIYYSSALMFFGAEFTQVYAREMGEEILPDKYAQPIEEYHKAVKS